MSEAAAQIDTGGGGTVIESAQQNQQAPATAVEQGGGKPSGGGWLDSLSADYRENPSITKFKSADELARGYINVQKAVGGEKMPAPREDWTDEQWGDLYTRLGRPADPMDYDLGEFAPPEGVEWSEEYQAEMLKVMHKHGANSALVQDVLKTEAQFRAESHEAMTMAARQETESGIHSLKNEWGKSFQPNVELAMQAWKAAAGESFRELASIKLDNGVSLGDDARIIKLFAKLGNSMSEHGLVGSEKGTRSTLSPGEASREIAKLQGDPDFRKAWLDKSHPEHAMAIEKMDSLTRMQLADEE